MSFDFTLFGLLFSVSLEKSGLWALGVSADIGFKPFFLNLRLSLIAPFDLFLYVSKAEKDVVDA